MTDLDNLKVMLTKTNTKFETEVDNFSDEVDLTFQFDWMSEAILFVFSGDGELKDIL